ncbi:MAG: alpha/beta hydrolase [Pirellulales bacterium]
MWRVARGAAVAYLTVLLLLMLFEESLIFFPTRYPEGDWHPAGLTLEDAHFTASDGTRLHGWYVDHPDPCATLLFAHGNAGNLSDRTDMLRSLHAVVGVRVLIFDYRGYGRSEGQPDEAGIVADARAARQWLAERTDQSPSDIVLMGRSLGGGVVVDLAAHDGARGLVLESTFTSLPDVAAYHYPWWLPVRQLMQTRLDSLHTIKDYHGPLLQSHGDADEIVPFRLGERLFQAAPNRSKQWITIPDGHHNDPQPASYYRQLRDWLDAI